MLSFLRQFHLNTSFYKLQSETYTPIKQVNLNGLEHSNCRFYLSTDVNGFKFQILFFYISLQHSEIYPYYLQYKTGKSRCKIFEFNINFVVTFKKAAFLVSDEGYFITSNTIHIFTALKLSVASHSCFPSAAGIN